MFNRNEFNDRFERDQRRFDFFFNAVFSMVMIVWVLIIVGLVLLIVNFGTIAREVADFIREIT